MDLSKADVWHCPHSSRSQVSHSTACEKSSGDSWGRLWPAFDSQLRPACPPFLPFFQMTWKRTVPREKFPTLMFSDRTDNSPRLEDVRDRLSEKLRGSGRFVSQLRKLRTDAAVWISSRRRGRACADPATGHWRTSVLCSETRFCSLGGGRERAPQSVGGIRITHSDE